MKTAFSSLVNIATFCAAVAFHGTAEAQTLITDFNTFFEDELYAAWDAPSAIINSDPNQYVITATGYGSNYTYIGEPAIMGAGRTHLELDVTLSGPAEANGHLGPIITLIDADGTNANYAWFGQTLGHHILTRAIATPTWFGAAGTTPGLDLNNLLHMHMQLDPGGFGTMGAYTVAWNNLALVDTPAPPTQVISTFNNFALNGTYDSWNTATLTSGPNSFRVQGSGFGGGFAPIADNVEGGGETHVELDVTINAGNSPNVIALLQDNDGTQYLYRWFSLAAGTHELGFRLETLTDINNMAGPNAIDQANSYPGLPGTTPGLDLDNLAFFQIQVEPSDATPYDVSFNNLRMKNIPGGFDTDEDSDGMDFLVWQRGLTPNPLSTTDLEEWEANYGSEGEALMAAVRAVPEPSAVALVLVSLGCITARRDWRSKR